MFAIFLGVVPPTDVQTEQLPVLKPAALWMPKGSVVENRLVLVLAKMARFALMQPEGENQSQYEQLHLQPVLDSVPIVRPSYTSVLKNKVKEKAEEVQARVKQVRKAKQTARQLKLFD